ncbi:MAG: helix-turn-helix domain-containing protein [Bilophila sp.]
MLYFHEGWLSRSEKHTARKYSSPLRERQASQTRVNILEAAQRLFLERGFAKTTIEAIAQEANVSKQTVYAVFRSKNGIVAELLDRAVHTDRTFDIYHVRWKPPTCTKP